MEELSEKMRKGRFPPVGFKWTGLGLWVLSLMSFGTFFKVHRCCVVGEINVRAMKGRALNLASLGQSFQEVFYLMF